MGEDPGPLSWCIMIEKVQLRYDASGNISNSTVSRRCEALVVWKGASCSDGCMMFKACFIEIAMVSGSTKE